MIRAYLRPALGARRLDELTARELDLHYVALLDRGGRNDKPLARRTVAHAAAILHKALADAVAVGLLDDNPADAATVPRVDARLDTAPAKLRTWDAAQVRRFLDLSRDVELGDVWRVALGTGMRRGELLGLRWEDVDLDVPQLRVAASLAHAGGRLRLKATKTRRVRTIHLDDATVAAIARQTRREPAPYPVVFTQSDGQPWHPPRVSDVWRRQWPKLDLSRIRLHDLRHTPDLFDRVRTPLVTSLQEGVAIKVVSERLGHAHVSMTLDVYAHVLPAMDRQASAALGRILGG
jgi:integrase